MQKFPFRSILYPKTAKKSQTREIFKLLQYIYYCLTNFDETLNGKAYRLLKLVSNQKFENFKIQVDRRHPTRKLRKILITFYLSAQNSVKSAYNRLPAKPLKYSNFYDIFADV